MVQIRTVVSPVDFTPLTEEELGLAVEVCQRFGSRLVLHHNESAAPPGFSRAWDWKQNHVPRDGRPAEPEERLRRLLEDLPEEIAGEASISRGAVVPALMALARELPADLIVVGCHGRTHDDHSSITERLIERAPCPVLTLHDHEGEDVHHLFPAGERKEPEVVVATDLSPGSERAASYAFELARTVPLRLHLLHVLTGRQEPSEESVEGLVAHLEETVPDDLEGRVGVHLATGEAVEGIVSTVRKLDADFLIMGEHVKGLLKSLLHRNTAKEVLHQAPCPVWYVP
ncbi:MAG: universal stress protein [Thermoanaerobaculia bacterium]|nr:universal stress protein [Thermoanaerobaculia bacterium]